MLAIQIIAGLLAAFALFRFVRRRTLLGGIFVLSAAAAFAITLLADVTPGIWLLYFVGFWLLFLLVAFLFLCAICAAVDLNKPQYHDSPFYRAVMYVYIEALKTLVGLKITTKGLEKTPKSGRFLLVCNHQNDSDPGVLLHCFRDSQLAFISKRENRNMFAVGKFMHRTMCQMINRENDREALKTILKCIQLIKDDEVSVAVFPEGGIKAEKKMVHFRSGVFKIAQKAKVPIVVCTLTGTTDLFRNLRRLRPTHAELHLVGIIPARELEGKTTVEIADRVYDMMITDLGDAWKPEM